MLIRIDPRWVQSDFINFEKLGKVSEGAKTDLYEIRNRDYGYILGYVRWYPAWRGYVFSPYTEKVTFFDKKCLTDIADFLIMVNTEHKEKLEAKKKNKRIFSIIDHEDYYRKKNEQTKEEVLPRM